MASASLSKINRGIDFQKRRFYLSTFESENKLYHPRAAAAIKSTRDIKIGRAACSLLSHRRDIVHVLGALIFSSATSFADPVFATPVRAPLPPGEADPADKAKLEAVAKFFESSVSRVQNPDNWPSIIEAISKVS